jgi:hypothetical protein
MVIICWDIMSFFSKLFKGKSAIEHEVLESPEFLMAKKYWTKGETAQQQRDYENAIHFFTLSYEANPVEPTALVSRSGSYIAKELYLLAWDDLIKAEGMYNGRAFPNKTERLKMIQQNKKIVYPYIMFEKESGDSIRGRLAQDGLDDFSLGFSEVIFRDRLKNNKVNLEKFIFGELRDIYEYELLHRDFVKNTGVPLKDISSVKDNEESTSAYNLFKCIQTCFSRDENTMWEVRSKILSHLIDLYKFL